jgi:hypothetical protein
MGTPKKTEHGKLTLETITSRILVIHRGSCHSGERFDEVGCWCVDERFWSCARLPRQGREVSRPERRKIAAVQWNWTGLSHQASFFAKKEHLSPSKTWSGRPVDKGRQIQLNALRGLCKCKSEGQAGEWMLMEEAEKNGPREKKGRS